MLNVTARSDSLSIALTVYGASIPVSEHAINRVEIQEEDTQGAIRAQSLLASEQHLEPLSKLTHLLDIRGQAELPSRKSCSSSRQACMTDMVTLSTKGVGGTVRSPFLDVHSYIPPLIRSIKDMMRYCLSPLPHCSRFSCAA